MPKRGMKLAQAVSHARGLSSEANCQAPLYIQLYPLLAINCAALDGIDGGVDCISGMGCVRSSPWDRRLSGSVAPVSYSQRTPRLTVRRSLTRQSSCR